MRHTTAITAALLLAGLTTGCSSGGEPKKETVTAVASASPTPTASPSPPLSQAETARLCSVAVSEAAPDWDDWDFDLGGWEEDPRTPEVCKGLADEEWPPRGNRAFQDALIDGLELADDPRAGS